MKEEFSRECVDSSSKFDEIFLKVLNVQLKKKMLRVNHAPCVCKALKKAIMKRSCLENVYFKNKTVILQEHTKSKNSIVVDYIKRK